MSFDGWGMFGGLEKGGCKEVFLPTPLRSAPRMHSLLLHTLRAGHAFLHPARLCSLPLFPGLEMLSAPSSSFSMFAVCVFVFLMKFVFQALTDWQGKQGYIFVLFCFYEHGNF